jgi:hypothetical protein
VMGFALDETRFVFQPSALFGEALLDGVLNGGANLDEIGGGHGFGFKRLCAH